MHPLSGTWTIRRYPRRDGDFPEEEPDGTFELKIEDDGTILTTSTHHLPDGTTAELMGDARPKPPNAISIGHSTGARGYAGFLVINQRRLQVLAGHYRLNKDRLLNQEQGTWVATKG